MQLQWIKPGNNKLLWKQFSRNSWRCLAATIFFRNPELIKMYTFYLSTEQQLPEIRYATDCPRLDRSVPGAAVFSRLKRTAPVLSETPGRGRCPHLALRILVTPLGSFPDSQLKETKKGSCHNRAHELWFTCFSKMYLHEPLLSSISRIMLDLPFSTSHNPVTKRKVFSWQSVACFIMSHKFGYNCLEFYF